MGRLNPAPAVVFDDSALLALGAGNRAASRLLVAAHAEAGRFVYAPALCLASAVATRPALAAHVGGLPAIEVLALDFPAAAAVGLLVGTGTPWGTAQAIHAARPSAEWPAGLPIVTTEPKPYGGHRLDVLVLS